MKHVPLIALTLGLLNALPVYADQVGLLSCHSDASGKGVFVELSHRPRSSVFSAFVNDETPGNSNTFSNNYQIRKVRGSGENGAPLVFAGNDGFELTMDIAKDSTRKRIPSVLKVKTEDGRELVKQVTCEIFRD